VGSHLQYSGAPCIWLDVKNSLKPTYHSPITGDFGSCEMTRMKPLDIFWGEFNLPVSKTLTPGHVHMVTPPSAGRKRATAIRDRDRQGTQQVQGPGSAPIHYKDTASTSLQGARSTLCSPPTWVHCWALQVRWRPTTTSARCLHTAQHQRCAVTQRPQLPSWRRSGTGWIQAPAAAYRTHRPAHVSYAARKTNTRQTSEGASAATQAPWLQEHNAHLDTLHVCALSCALCS
jgi:hypothetical protein